MTTKIKKEQKKQNVVGVNFNIENFNNPNDDEVHSLVFRTTDYDKFEFIDINRDYVLFTSDKPLKELKSKRIDKLKESFEKYEQFVPIIVNTDFQLIEGQGRFIAALQLGKPINYQIKDIPLEAIIDLNNARKSWNINDYLNLYTRVGTKKSKETYKYFSEVSIEYNKLSPNKSKVLRHNELMILFVGGEAHTPLNNYNFKSGKLDLKVEKEELEDKLDWLFYKLSPYLAINTRGNRYFQRAIFHLLNNEKFSREKFEKTLEKRNVQATINSIDFITSTINKTIVNSIIKIYNSGVPRKQGLSLL